MKGLKRDAYGPGLAGRIGSFETSTQQKQPTPKASQSSPTFFSIAFNSRRLDALGYM